MSEVCITNIQRYSVHDGPGIRTTIFFKGCPLQCVWCANPECMDPEPMVFYKQSLCSGDGLCIRGCPRGAISADPSAGIRIDREKCVRCGTCVDLCLTGALSVIGRRMKAEEILSVAKKDWLFYRNSGGGVTLSGGEPLAWPEGARRILKGLKQNAIHTAMETTGNVDRATLEGCLPWLDLILFDLKQTDTKKHRRLTGAGNERILDNLRWLGTTEKKIWVRMPIVPGVNDDPLDPAEVAAIVNELKGLERVELLPYHPWGRGKYQSIGILCPLPAQREPDPAYMAQLRDRLGSRIRVPVMV